MSRTLFLLALLCAGCGQTSGNTGRPLDPYVYRDRLTGCDYLGSSHGITPRMGADGKQICGGAK